MIKNVFALSIFLGKLFLFRQMRTLIGLFYITGKMFFLLKKQGLFGIYSQQITQCYVGYENATSLQKCNKATSWGGDSDHNFCVVSGRLIFVLPVKKTLSTTST